MNEGLFKRIQRKDPRITDALSFLKSLSHYDRDHILHHLSEWYEEHLSPHTLFERYRRSRFLQPCTVSQRDLFALEMMVYDAIPHEWDTVELSPVAPLGVNSNLTRVNQKNILSALRRMEVQADVTMGLALECAARRSNILRQIPTSVSRIHLCSHQRCLRTQSFRLESGFTPHFKVFGACSAGRDEGMERFEVDMMIQHIETYLTILSLSREVGYRATTPVITISHMGITERYLEYAGLREKARSFTQSDFDMFRESGIAQKTVVESLDELLPLLDHIDCSREIAYLAQIDKKLVRPLRERYPHVSFFYDAGRIAGIGYYPSLAFKLTAVTNNGSAVPLADGGLVPWTQKLLESKKERLFISGFGTELFCRTFRNN